MKFNELYKNNVELLTEFKLKAPPIIAKQVEEFVVSCFAVEAVKFLTKIKNESTSNEEIKLVDSKIRVLQQLRSVNISENERVFDVNEDTLTNWEYNKYFKKAMVPMRFEVLVVKDPLMLKKEIAGRWCPDQELFLVNSTLGTLIIEISRYLNSSLVYQIDEVLRLIKNTCYHELQHVVQNILGLELSKDKSDWYGLPKRRIRNKEANEFGVYDSDKLIGHSLRDIEFHTNATDILSAIKSSLMRVPENLRRELFRYKIGELNYNMSSNSTIRWNGNPEPKLYQLKEDAPEKWREYVKILYKQLQHEGLL